MIQNGGNEKLRCQIEFGNWPYKKQQHFKTPWTTTISRQSPFCFQWFYIRQVSIPTSDHERPFEFSGAWFVSVYYIYCFWLYGFHMFYVVFLLNAYAAICFEQRKDIMLLFIKLDDRPMMIGHSSFFFNPLCGRAVVQLRGWSKYYELYDHQWKTHIHQNHCQQKTFDLTFNNKNKWRSPHKKLTLKHI